VEQTLHRRTGQGSHIVKELKDLGLTQQEIYRITKYMAEGRHK
jgi:hypothetical protein